MENKEEIIEEINEEQPTEKTTEKSKEKTKLLDKIKKFPYKPAIVFVIILIIALLIPKQLPSIFQSSSLTKIEKICELSTVEAYYHNVAAETKPVSSKIGEILGNIGYKRYWVEYDAIIKYGINAKKVKIEAPNIKNEVKVFIPEAEVLGEPILITELVQDPITDTGFLTTVTPEDKNKALENSIKTLKEESSKDVDNLKLARDRAKTFFEKYIVNAGKEMGVEYKVIFEDEKNQQ